VRPGLRHRRGSAGGARLRPPAPQARQEAARPSQPRGAARRRAGRRRQHFTLKERPLARADLDDFVAAFNPANRHERSERERFKPFAYDELLKRDKVNLDLFWLRDEALEESANLPAPDVIAREIVDDLEAALEQFAAVADDLAG
jgi:type I restriction enzyme M protein